MNQDVSYEWSLIDKEMSENELKKQEIKKEKKANIIFFLSVCLFSFYFIMNILIVISLLIHLLVVILVFALSLAHGFSWRWSDSKYPQVSWTFLRILSDLKNDVSGMASTCSLISKSSSPLTNHLMTVPSAPLTIGITVTFMF